MESLENFQDELVIYVKHKSSKALIVYLFLGDTPILGAGTYCDNRYGGISTTGHGETLMKVTAKSTFL